MQIGICGTFDVQNYGDLLFPLIAETELSRRLGPVTLRPFSYFDKAPPDWPYHVTSVAELPKIAGELDGLIVGGGHLIRFDKDVAPGYRPPTPDIHHPTGYWLAPALIGLHHGCPVVWGAPGVLGQVPAWAAPLMRLAIGLSRYVAVRDDHARAALAPFAGEQEIAVVPDTGYGLAHLLERSNPSPALLDLRRSVGLTRPYFVVQATRGLDHFARLVAHHAPRFAGHQFVAMPVGPALGDDAAILGDDYPDLVRLPAYPDPLLLAELVAGATAVIGISLHLAITAIVFGVPVFRPASALAGKYAGLSRHAQVHAFAVDREIDPAWFDARLAHRGRGSEMTGIEADLDRHWDKVASCFLAGRETPDRRGAFLWQQLPGVLELKSMCDDALIGSLRRMLDLQHDTLSQRDRQVARFHDGHAISSSDAEPEQAIVPEETEDTAMAEGTDVRTDTAGYPAPAGNQSMDPIAHLEHVIAERDRQITRRDSTVAARDRETAQQREAIAQRDERIRHLTESLAEREREIAAAKASVDDLRREVMARQHEVQALRNSTSWKVTAPLRWIRSRAPEGGVSGPRIIRLDRIAHQRLTTVPYEWAFVNGLFSRRAGESLVRSYPRDNFKTVKGYDGEKGYEYEARALIHMNAGSPSFPEGLSGAWRMLADDLLSPGYRAAMTRLTARDLSAAPMEAYVCHFGPGAWLGPHLDLKDKIVTHVFYFNASWQAENGGCLSILRSSDMSDKVAEIVPIVGNSSVLIRSENSWHAVSRVTNDCLTSRRSMNVIFYRPGAVSTMWPPGEKASLHWYEPTAEAAG